MSPLPTRPVRRLLSFTTSLYWSQLVPLWLWLDPVVLENPPWSHCCSGCTTPMLVRAIIRCQRSDDDKLKSTRTHARWLISYLWQSRLFSRFHLYRWSRHQRSKSLLAQKSHWNRQPGNKFCLCSCATHLTAHTETGSTHNKNNKSLRVKSIFLTFSLSSPHLSPRSLCCFLAL